MRIKNNGFDGKAYFEELFKEIDKGFNTITNMNETDKNIYNKMLLELKEVNFKRKKFSNDQKKKALEDIVSFILETSGVFEVHRDIHTSSNEIDQLVRLNEKGTYFKNKGYIDVKGNYFISECKNYKGSVGVTWIGKLYSLIETQNCNLGILFSYNGISGKRWNAGVGLIKKLFLTKEKNNKIYIIDFNINDFELLLKNVSFLTLMKKKMEDLETDTNVFKYLKKHPGELKTS